MDKIEDEVEDEIKDMFPGRSPCTCPNIVLILYGMDKVRDEVEVKDVEVKDKTEDTR